jgi:hypothetical protein
MKFINPGSVRIIEVGVHTAAWNTCDMSGKVAKYVVKSLLKTVCEKKITKQTHLVKIGLRT